MANRREFLQVALGTAGLVGLQAARLNSSAQAATGTEKADQKLKILVLGGTGFIGPHQIEYALARGHELTVFNRGNKAGLYGDRIEELVGNRDTKIDDGLKLLEGDRKWDVVIDNSGYVPRHVRDAIELLKDRCQRYIYVSTVAVYDTEAASVFPENGPLAELSDPTVEEVTWDTYGPLKAACDKLVTDTMGARGTVVRPTYIVGPGDHTDRFTYWVDRIQRGGDIPGPAHAANTNVQAVDVRDLCPWLITLAENDTPGTFNAAGPIWTRAGMLWGIRAAFSAESTFYWPTPEVAAEVEAPTPMLEWGESPISFVNSASREAGIVYRPLADSAVDTLSWWSEQGSERHDNPRGWPTEAQEQAIVAKMK